MLTLKSKWLTLLGALLAAVPAFAQDNKALIDALVKKGILTNDEATQIAAEVSKGESAMDVSTGGSKFIKKIALQARFQTQFAGLTTSIDGAAANPPATQHFLVRRLYLGVKPDFGDGWSGNFNYDFANLSFDAALISWKQSDALVIDAGLRKVPFAYDEITSSGNLKAIERSPITRYFVEGNNGRRLGAGSYHTGLWIGSAQDARSATPLGLYYTVAITNPERDEFSTGDSSTNSTPGVNAVGSKANNNFAAWGSVGYGGKFADGSFKVGLDAGRLPDQGGKTVGTGHDLTVYSLYGDVTSGAFNLQGAWLTAKNEQGVSATQDAKPWGYWIMPSIKNGNWEGLVRYSYIDSDHRGVDLGDGIRSAPSGGTMNKMSEWFIGGNYYFHGNDTKLQAGYIHGESKDTVTGGAAQAKTDGVRTQVQLNF
jgi:hypothetical protein